MDSESDAKSISEDKPNAETSETATDERNSISEEIVNDEKAQNSSTVETNGNAPTVEVNGSTASEKPDRDDETLNTKMNETESFAEEPIDQTDDAPAPTDEVDPLAIDEPSLPKSNEQSSFDEPTQRAEEPNDTKANFESEKFEDQKRKFDQNGSSENENVKKQKLGADEITINRSPTESDSKIKDEIKDEIKPEIKNEIKAEADEDGEDIAELEAIVNDFKSKNADDQFIKNENILSSIEQMAVESVEKPETKQHDKSDEQSEQSKMDIENESAAHDASAFDFDLSEKLKDMGEISLGPVSKGDRKSSSDYNLGDEVSLELMKKSSASEEDKRKFSNLRKNIREVMDDTQLDASTLAAQREELERLTRVQEQQRQIREMQRQIALERQTQKTQNRVLSLLQGHTSLLKSSASASGSSKPQSSAASTSLLKSSAMKTEESLPSPEGESSLLPSVSIAPIAKQQKKSDDSEANELEIEAPIELLGEDEEIGESHAKEDDEDESPLIDDDQMAMDEEDEEDDDVIELKPRKDIVTIEDSSSDDDCILLSDEEEEVPDDGDDDPQNSGLHVNDTYNVPDDQGRVVINIGHPEGEPDIFLAPQIARVIKPHQIGGVRFLFDNIIESVERFSTSTGFGCILAHSMGLGKTLQLCCFCDIFLRHTNSKTILCIMPINTLQNWLAEFNMWLPEDPEKSPLFEQGEVRPRNFKLFVLNDTHKTLNARSKVVLDWAREGGVLLMGYELYRLLSMKKMTKRRSRKAARDPEVEEKEAEEQKKLLDEMHSALVKPGPDLIVCDEGHRIKNSHASISVALKQIRSKRRIVLTGYPLQNNLLEYWCMVDFVRPNYLGTKTEFSNMFERPIQNGQCIDSTPQDIKLMRYRAHVLHSLLLGFVQRRSHVVLQNSLPPKEEYVLLVRMTPFQRKLYDVFMNEVVRTKAVPNPLKAFAVCCKIWNHPDVLYNFLKKREADLDLEEAEAAAADPTYDPTENGDGKTAKGAKKRAPKGKKAAAEAKKAEAEAKKAEAKKNVVKKVDAKGKGKEQKPAASILPNTIEKEASKMDATNDKSVATKTDNKSDSISQEQSYPVAQSKDTNVPPQNSHHPTPYSHHMTPSSQMSMSSNYPPPYGNYPSAYGTYNQYDPSYYSGYSQYNNYYNQEYGSAYNQQDYGQSHAPNASNYWSGSHQYYDYPHNNYPNYAGSDHSNFHNQTTMPAQHSMYPPSNYHAMPQQQMNSMHGNSSNASNAASSLSWPAQNQTSNYMNPQQSATTSANIQQSENNKPETLVDVKKIDDATKCEEEKEPKAEIKDEVAETKSEEKSDDEKGKDVKEEKVDEKETLKVKDDGIPYDWAVELMKGFTADLIENSAKMQIFFCILEECVRIGDRMLVFSQSLLTLNLIERFLQANPTKVTENEIHWSKNTNYFRKSFH